MQEIDLQEWENRLKDFQLHLDSREYQLSLCELDLKQKMDMLNARERVLDSMVKQKQKENKE